MALMGGCFAPIAYDKRQATISPGETFQIKIQVAKDEILEGSWEADEAIEGTYQCPDGTTLYWTTSSIKYTFVIKGEDNPGLYTFGFRNRGDKKGTVTFRYRTKT
jgi:hypothetical protein